MAFNSESSYTNSCREFGRALKAARERKGITLTEIANSTKVPASLFAGLERGDLRRWPKGLFRRSFFRDYARMIGLSPAEACAEFVRLFPDGPRAGLAMAADAAEEADQEKGLRLALDTTWHGPRTSGLSRLLALLIDALAVALVAAAVAWVWSLDRTTATAIVALAYFSLATALFGESPAKWAMCRQRSISEAMTHGTVAVAAAWKRSADSIPHLLDSTGAGAPEAPQQLRVPVKISQ